jgi:hypothetical protein
MASWEVKGVMIMLQEQRLEMCQRVFLTEDAPYANLILSGNSLFLDEEVDGIKRTFLIVHNTPVNLLG